jgi:hypothetical protein
MYGASWSYSLLLVWRFEKCMEHPANSKAISRVKVSAMLGFGLH